MMWGADYVHGEATAEFINDRVHANIQRDGTFSVVPQMKGGVTTPTQLRRIADVAEKYEVPMVKVTGGQRIDLLGVRKEDLPAMWADLGMPSGYAYGKSMRTVKTCVGIDFCRFGLGDSTQLGIDLETRFQGIESPAKIKMAVVGCPRNCAEAYVKDVGVVAVGNGKWEVYVGGAAGATVRKGDLLATVDSPEEVLTLTGRFLQYYRENANWLERTYDFVPRVGSGRDPSRCSADDEGIAPHLDAGIQRSIDAYTDPWGQDSADRPRPASSAPRCRWSSCRRCRSDEPHRRARPDRHRAHRHRTRRRPAGGDPDGGGAGLVAGGEQVAVFRLRDGSLHATQAACPHAGGPLADGQTDVDVLVCPLHLYAYRWSDGAATSGAAPIRVFPVREQDGTLLVTV